jgi:CheY-like chemotaxis protein
MPEIAPDLHGVYVLVVDDNEDSREILLTYLAHVGAAARAARNAGDALAALGELRAHVIVTDLMMPAIDGFEFLQRLRQMPGEAEHPTPVIAFSGFKDEKPRAIRSGFASFITKPAEPTTIAREIKRVLSAQLPK